MALMTCFSKQSTIVVTTMCHAHGAQKIPDTEIYGDTMAIDALLEQDRKHAASPHDVPADPSDASRAGSDSQLMLAHGALYDTFEKQKGILP